MTAVAAVVGSRVMGREPGRSGRGRNMSHSRSGYCRAHGQGRERCLTSPALSSSGTGAGKTTWDKVLQVDWKLSSPSLGPTK